MQGDYENVYRSRQRPDVLSNGVPLKLSSVPNSRSDPQVKEGSLNYSASSRCTWIIESDRRDALVIKLEDFFTECCWDNLYVFDGKQVADNLIGVFR